MSRQLRLVVSILLICLFASLQYKAECAIYDVQYQSDINGKSATAAELFQIRGNNYYIFVHKCCLYSYGKPVYHYTMSFNQPATSKPIEVSKIIIMSENMNVTMYKGVNDATFSGLESRADYVSSHDTGLVNTVLLSAHQKLLIRVVDKYNYYYDFFATEDLIDKCKKVANWS